MEQRRPDYFVRDFPGEQVEDSGRYCELYVVGIHENADPETCDQNDIDQWRFMVVPAKELNPRTRSMRLDRAIMVWPPVAWNGLRREVDAKIGRLRRLERGKTNLRRDCYRCRAHASTNSRCSRLFDTPWKKLFRGEDKRFKNRYPCANYSGLGKMHKHYGVLCGVITPVRYSRILQTTRIATQNVGEQDGFTISV
jgi:hypothetical protein